MRRAFRLRFERVLRRLEARNVAPEATTEASVIVSIAAGVVLGAGGAAHEPRLWLLVPSLALGRFGLSVVGAHLEGRRRP